jgi:prepilin-type N-terminal cleavage/methylation domain-containing protein
MRTRSLSPFQAPRGTDPGFGHALSRPRGFTLVELLIVLGIVSALVALGLVVGGQVTAGSRSRVTEQLIYTLDQSLDAYTADKGDIPPPVYTYKSSALNAAADVFDFAAIDGRPLTSPSGNTSGISQENWYNRRDAVIPTGAIYAKILEQSGQGDAILKSVPSKFTRVRFIDQWYDGTASEANPNSGSPLGAFDVLTTNNVNLQSVEVIDPWGNAIRYVHPGYGGNEFFDGGSGDYWNGTTVAKADPDSEAGRPLNHQAIVRWGAPNSLKTMKVRRSFRPFADDDAAQAQPNHKFQTGDSDEGICPTRRPYFYSAGADGDPGRRADNIYTTKPEFADDTGAIE